MSLLTGIKWFEWVFICVCVSVVWWGYHSSNRIAELEADKAVLTTDLKSVNDDLKFKDESAEITDKVVSDFTESTVQAQSTQQKTREDVIDEYLAVHSTGSSNDNSTAGSNTVDESRATPQRETVPDVATPKVRLAAPVYPVVDSVALHRLADRMHERYCGAGGTKASCTTN